MECMKQVPHSSQEFQAVAFLRALSISLPSRKEWGKVVYDSGSSVVKLPERQLQGFLVFQSFSFEFLRFARRWGTSAASPRLADLVPAENLISWKVMRLLVCKLITVMTSAAPDFFHWCPWRLFKKTRHQHPAFFSPSSLFMQVQYSVLHVPWQADSTI